MSEILISINSQGRYLQDNRACNLVNITDAEIPIWKRRSHKISMKLRFYNKIVAWVLCASLLNLLLLVTPLSAAWGTPLQSGQVLSGQAQSMNAMPCHDTTVATPDDEKPLCDQHSNTKCENDCTTCVVVYFTLPVKTQEFMQETDVYMESNSNRLISPDYSPNPHPPKRFS